MDETSPEAAGPLTRSFAPGPAMRWIAALLVVYAVAFAVFYPPTVTVTDENNYVRQAQLVLQGGPTVERVDPVTGDISEFRPLNEYPLGTALLLVPFVAAGGRGAAHWLPLLCVLIGVWVTACWLRDQGRSPFFAVLVLAYPATLVMGRVAMSEAPSLALVACGLWLYFRGLRGPEGGAAAWLGAGFLAGASLAFREANVLLFAPFFLGSLVRRERGWWWLAVGGLLGVGVRLASAAAFFGDPWFAKSPDEFALSALADTLPLYGTSLLVLVPGGLATALLYRGPRRPELVGTVFVFFCFHLLYEYSGEPSGWAKRLVLGPRYFIPLLPLLALASAERWPVWARSFAARLSVERAAKLERRAAQGIPVAGGAIAAAIVAVQWMHFDWARGQAAMRDAIEAHTVPGSVVVSNLRATGKFMDYVEGGRVVVPRDAVGRREAELLLEAVGSFYVVLLDRSDADFWRRDAFDNEMFVVGLRRDPSLLVDLRSSPTDRLRIWRFGEEGDAAETPAPEAKDPERD